jgi:predicted secreted protein
MEDFDHHQSKCVGVQIAQCRESEDLLIVTAPHAACFDSDENRHYCDYVAGISAKVLNEEARAIGNTCFFNNPDVYRPEHDLNRYEGRSHGFRPALTALITKIASNERMRSTALVIDVHSYPYDYQFSSQSRSDTVIVFMEPRIEPRYSLPIILALREHGIVCDFVQGHSTVNDIEYESREAGIASFLMEVREQVLSVADLRRAMKVVATSAFQSMSGSLSVDSAIGMIGAIPARDRIGEEDHRVGELFVVEVPANPSTGSTWKFKATNGLSIKHRDFWASCDAPGCGGTEYIVLQATTEGRHVLAGSYGQHWRESGQSNQWIFFIKKRI